MEDFKLARLMLRRVGILSVAKWQTVLGLLSGIFSGVVNAAYYFQRGTLSEGDLSFIASQTPAAAGAR